jgi:D-xylose transport system substrate-binding protein
MANGGLREVENRWDVLMRIRASALLILLMVVTAGCSGTHKVADPPVSHTVALFLPHAGADRYEAMDRPYFKLRLKHLCPQCEVDYRNAGNKQEVQDQQVREALDKGAEVLVLDPVDSKNATGIVELAKRRNVPVISYDRLILNTQIDYYLSFDNVKVGYLAGTSLLEAMGEKAATGQILWVNGPPADNNAVMYKQGAHQALDGKVGVAGEFTMVGPQYSPKAVESWLAQIIPTIDVKKIVGVYCVDDVSAGLAANALAAAGATTMPPITGHNADIAGMQRMLVGKQYMSVYKPVQREAESAAQLAYDLLRGMHPQAPTTTDNKAGPQQSFLLEPQSITRNNLKETVIKDGFVTVGALCAAEYTEACRQAGIS